MTRLGQVDFVDVFATQTILFADGILARGEFLEVVTDFLGVVCILCDTEVFATATASATVAFADVEAFDLFEGDGVRADRSVAHKVLFDLYLGRYTIRWVRQALFLQKGGAGVFTPPPLGIQQRL